MEQQPNKEEVFQFLDDLRESGIANMFEAGSYIQDVFNVSKEIAKKLLVEWMETLSKRHSQD